MSEAFAAGIRWDLSDLYESIDDPRISEDLDKLRQMAPAFRETYQPAFENPEAAEDLPMEALLKDLESFLRLQQKLAAFSLLSFSVQTDQQRVGAFSQRIQETLTDIQSDLMFFFVQWKKWPEDKARAVLDRPALAPYRHYLEKQRVLAPYTLSEPEEKILSMKYHTGRRAFVRLFDEVKTRIPYRLLNDEGPAPMTESEVLGLLQSPDREVRRNAAESLSRGLASEDHVMTYCTNMVLADHRLNMKLRGYEHPMDPQNLSNETERADIMNLIRKVKDAYPLTRRFYRLKKELLGLKDFCDYDRYAPLQNDEKKISFDECRALVIDGYSAFSEEAGAIVKQFFDGHWIDAEIRSGKQSGGFCCSTIPDLHPYILVNYGGSLRDVMVIAHELGHGLHQWLAAKNTGILELSAPLTMAETASVFGEMLIFEKILAEEKDPRTLLALICGKIDDNFATVFRQIALTDFELRAHEAGLREGELSHEQLCEHWVAANEALYGDSVILSESYRRGWQYIPHFQHTPFYCYAYAFAQLFVLTLFKLYQQDSQSFLPRYFEILGCGGSRKPEDMAALLNQDLKNPDFWDAGISLLEEWVGKAEDLARTLGETGA